MMMPGGCRSLYLIVTAKGVHLDRFAASSGYLHDVVHVEDVEVDDHSPSGDLDAILDDEDNEAVDPHPQRNLLAILVVPDAAHGYIIEDGARPHKGQGGGEGEGEAAAAKEDGVGAAQEEELLGGTGGEERHNIRDGDLEENHVHDLPVLEPSDAEVAENSGGVPGGEAPPEEKEGGEAGDHGEGNGHHEDDGKHPTLGVLRRDGVIVTDRDQRTVVDEGDDDQEDNWHGEISRPEGAISGRPPCSVFSGAVSKHRNEEEGQQLQCGSDSVSHTTFVSQLSECFNN